MFPIGSSSLDLDGEPMPIEAFRDLYHVPGFKYEYVDGRADISVQRSAQATVAAPTGRIVERTDSSVPDDVEMESAANTPVGDLESLWVNAFARTPDYYGWAIEDIRDDARKSLDRLFGEEALPSWHWRGDLAAAAWQTAIEGRRRVWVGVVGAAHRRGIISSSRASAAA
jgi:hypothetical protein